MVLALVDADWVMTSELAAHLEKRARSAGQSRVNEDGFLQGRRAEHVASSVRVSHAPAWYCLVGSGVLDKKYRWQTLDLLEEPSRLQELPDSASSPVADKCTVPLTGLRSYQKSATMAYIVAEIHHAFLRRLVPHRSLCPW